MDLPSRVLVLLTLGLPLLPAQDVANPADPLPLEELPRLPGLVSLHQSSSHNRRGDNGDATFCLYRDADGSAVILDAAGPGCVRSIWATDIQDDAVLRFWFDGEERPRYRIGMKEFFEGGHPQFPAPLCSLERRGRWGENPFAGNCFVPIPFSERIKIAVEGELRFFHILYERYPHGTPVSTFDGEGSRGVAERLVGDPDASVRFVEEPVRHDVGVEALPPGESLLVLDSQGSGTVRRLVLEGDATESFLRSGRIEMHWDHQPRVQVRAPVGFFFGVGMRPADLASVAMQAERLEDGRLRLTSRLPMPFWESARIAVVNGGAKPFGALKARVEIDPSVLPAADAAHLVGQYRRGATTWGRDWTFFDTPGTGRLVAVVQSMLGGHYCEGDEHFYVDGAVSPQIHGTGSEDYFLGCFWPNREYADPFSWCVGDVQALGGGTFEDAYRVPAVYGRAHLDAPVPFLGHLAARIQHGGSNRIESSYESLALAYLRPRPALTLTDLLDVASPASEAAHEYEASASERTEPITATPEGEWLYHPIRASGRTHDGGEIRFRVALDPHNAGVRLRRRLDQGSPRQAARVFVDGKYAGLWYHADHNPHLRWFDSDLDIHPQLTRDKESIEVRLEVLDDPGYGAFTDFRYEVFCLER